MSSVGLNDPRARNTIAGALARYFASGKGLTHASISSCFALAGYDESETDAMSTKQERVSRAVRKTGGETARLLIEEVLSLLRNAGYFDLGAHLPLRTTLANAFDRHGITLTDDGYVEWEEDNPPSVAGATVGSARAEKQQRDDHLGPAPPQAEVTVPTLDLLLQVLRRLPFALRPLTIRRRHRTGLEIRDEYDLQDAVESVLRSLFNDVRAEERTPSYAGSGSVMDFLLKREAIAVEVKVTAAYRTDKHIKPELLVDFEDYRQHPSVKTLIAVVYDIASTFRNPAGFEEDLTGPRNGICTSVIVVGWPLPLKDARVT